MDNKLTLISILLGFSSKIRKANKMLNIFMFMNLTFDDSTVCRQYYCKSCPDFKIRAGSIPSSMQREEKLRFVHFR
jgi:hypothetical protein